MDRISYPPSANSASGIWASETMDRYALMGFPAGYTKTPYRIHLAVTGMMIRSIIPPSATRSSFQELPLEPKVIHWVAFWPGATTISMYITEAYLRTYSTYRYSRERKHWWFGLILMWLHHVIGIEMGIRFYFMTDECTQPSVCMASYRFVTLMLLFHSAECIRHYSHHLYEYSSLRDAHNTMDRVKLFARVVVIIGVMSTLSEAIVCSVILATYRNDFEKGEHILLVVCLFILVWIQMIGHWKFFTKVRRVTPVHTLTSIPPAVLSLSSKYKNGLGVSMDASRAFDLCHQAALQGNNEAMFHLSHVSRWIWMRCQPITVSSLVYSCIGVWQC